MAAKKNDKQGHKLFLIGMAIFALGGFLSYGVVLFFGALMMIASFLPASGKTDDPL